MQVYWPSKFHGNSLSCWIYISRLVAVYKTLQQFCCSLYYVPSMAHPSITTWPCSLMSHGLACVCHIHKFPPCVGPPLWFLPHSSSGKGVLSCLCREEVEVSLCGVHLPGVHVLWFVAVQTWFSLLPVTVPLWCFVVKGYFICEDLFISHTNVSWAWEIQDNVVFS